MSILGAMSEPAHDLPADDPTAPLAGAVDGARHGVITHLTVDGVRVAAIVPESVLDALRAAEDADDARAADEAFAEGGEPVSLEEVAAEFGL